MSSGQEPLGYVVAVSRDWGMHLPSFTDIYETAEEAETEIGRLTSTFRPLAEGERFVVLEVREVEETAP